MEAAWLQAQIKPHFLFNTLNMIASLSEIDPAVMGQLLEEFGHYLRKSFDVQNIQTLVALDHELELVRAYLYIEKVRFGERLQVEWALPEKDYKWNGHYQNDFLQKSRHYPYKHLLKMQLITAF